MNTTARALLIAALFPVACGVPPQAQREITAADVTDGHIEIIRGSLLSDAIITMSSMNVIAGELDA